jgi:hypothetical protein
LLQIFEYDKQLQPEWTIRAKSYDSLYKLLDSIWHYHSLAEKFTEQLSCRIGDRNSVMPSSGEEYYDSRNSVKPSSGDENIDTIPF